MNERKIRSVYINITLEWKINANDENNAELNAIVARMHIVKLRHNNQEQS